MFIDSDVLEKVIFAALPQYKPWMIGAAISHDKNYDGSYKSIATLVFSVEKQQGIEENITDFLNRLGASFDAINFVFSVRAKVTKPAILRAIKISQPVKLQAVESYFQERSFFFTTKTLHNDLDELRKDGYIIWEEGNYSVTEAALSMIPHGNSRLSSDIVRALEFRSKKW